MRAPVLNNRVTLTASAVLFAGVITMDLLGAANPGWHVHASKWWVSNLHDDALAVAAVLAAVGLIRGGVPRMAAGLYRMAYRHGAEDIVNLYARPEYKDVEPLVSKLPKQRGLRHRFRPSRPNREMTRNDNSTP